MAVYMSGGSFSRTFFWKKYRFLLTLGHWVKKGLNFSAKLLKRLSKLRPTNPEKSLRNNSFVLENYDFPIVFRLLAVFFWIVIWKKIAVLSKFHSSYSEEQIEEKEFILWKLSLPKFFGTSAKKIWDFIGIFSHGSQNLIPYVPRNLLSRIFSIEKICF